MLTMTRLGIKRAGLARRLMMPMTVCVGIGKLRSLILLNNVALVEGELILRSTGLAAPRSYVRRILRPVIGWAQ